MVFLKEIFEKVDFENNQQMKKKSMKNFPGGKELKLVQLVSAMFGCSTGAKYGLGLWDHTALSYELNKQQQSPYFGRSRVNTGETSKFPKS